MMLAEIEPALNESTTRLLRAIGHFSSHNFNEELPGDAWNAGQIAEHILLTDIFISRIMQKELTFAGRRHDEKVTRIKEVCEDNGQKQEAPKFGLPSSSMKDPLAIQQRISQARHLILNHLNTIEEESLCTDYSHPVLGTLTVTEWVWFIFYHTERHLLQLRALSDEFKNAGN